MLSSKVRMLSVLAFVAMALPAQAQDFPAQPITMVTGAKAGSDVDTLARLIGDRFSQDWQQKIVVLNHEGDDGLTAAKEVAAAPKDGYTLLVTEARTYTILPIQRENTMGINLHTSFAPVGLIGERPIAIAIGKNVNVTSINELVSTINASPDGMKYTAGAALGQSRLAGELFREKAKAKIQFEPSKDILAAVRQVMDKRVPIIFGRSMELAGADMSGTVNLLAVTASKRMPEFPTVPTVSETFPGLVANDWVILLAPAGTPDAIVEKINAGLSRATAQRETLDWFGSLGTIANNMSARETAEFILAEQRTWWPIAHRLKE